jgi:dihydroorotate dehydrogenase
VTSKSDRIAAGPGATSNGGPGHGAKPPLELEPLIISAPFGNYIQPADTTPTLGTFTAARRGGRPAATGRAILTVRYYRKLGAWVNRIGLRNPGIDGIYSGPKRTSSIDQSIVSIHGFVASDWNILLERITHVRPLAVELNISCPNVGEMSWPRDLFADAVATGVPVIVKLPPVRYRNLVSEAASAGVNWFHACNTLPVAGGGMSGAPLKPISLQVVKWLRSELGPQGGIIGGGGISAPEHVIEYADAGADRFAVGTFAMRPSAPFSDKWVSEIRSVARDVVVGKV